MPSPLSTTFLLTAISAAILALPIVVAVLATLAIAIEGYAFYNSGLES